MTYTYHDLIKRKAKQLSEAMGIPLSKALERKALEYGFAHNYEMATVAKRNPTDRRLMWGALGVNDLKDALDEGTLSIHIQDLADDALSGEVADTNAYDFTVDGVEVIGAIYEPDTGTLDLQVAFQYSGEQDPDKPLHATEFYITNARIRFCWRGGNWELKNGSKLEILEMQTDRDRDYEEQRAEGLI